MKILFQFKSALLDFNFSFFQLSGTLTNSFIPTVPIAVLLNKFRFRIHLFQFLFQVYRDFFGRIIEQPQNKSVAGKC